MTTTDPASTSVAMDDVPRRGRRVAGDAFAGLVLAVASSTSWVRVFGVDWYVVGLLSAMVGVVAGLVALTLRSRAAGLVGAVVILWVGVALLTADPISNPAAWATAPYDGLVQGWSGLLSIPLPVPGEREFLALPVTLVALVGLVGTATFEPRTRPVAVGMALLVWFVGLMMGVGGYGTALRLVLPLVILVLVVLLVAALAGNQGIAVLDRVAKAVVVGVLALLVAGVVGPQMSGAFGREAPYDPREAIKPPTQEQALANPLDSMGAQLKTIRDAVKPEVFTAKVSSSSAVKPSTYWEVTTFDRYDGVGWSTSGAATRAATVRRPELAVPVDRVNQRVTPGEGVLPYVPHAGLVTRLETSGLYVNRTADTVLVGAPDAATRTYVLQAEVPRPSADDLVAATGDQVPPEAVETGTPPSTTCLPAEWAAPIRQAASGESYAGTANAVIAWVRGLNVEVSVDARPGSSCQRLQELVNEPALATSEQLATVAVLALRTTGISARLGFGYRLLAPAPDGTYTVRTSDVVAYPEIWYDGIGWLPREVAPAEASLTAKDQAVDPTQEVQDVASQETAGDTGTGPGPGNKDQASPASQAGLGAVTRAAVGVALVVLVVGGWIGLVAAIRSRRRRRARTSGDPRARVAGAWSDVLRDTAPELGATRPIAGRSSGREGLTVGEASVRLVERYPEAGGSVATLASLMESATYSPLPVSENEATAAWRDRDAISAVSRRSRTAIRRTRTLFDPRL